jgi:hypothetical protein
MTIVTLMGRPLVLCDACYDALRGSALVVYPQPHACSHFPAVRAYCDETCLARGEQGHVGPTITVPWMTFLQDLPQGSERHEPVER